MMKAVVVEAFGDMDNLHFKEIPSKPLSVNDVKVRTIACALNFPDLLILEKKYQFLPDLPYIPCGESTGIVIEVGAEVQNVKVGDKVGIIERWGALAEEIILNEERVFPIKMDVNLVETSSLIYNASTALYALKNRGNATKGETILVLGTGGVALAAVQIAKILGLKVIWAGRGSFTTIDVEATIDYTRVDLKDEIRRITNDGGVDIVFDTVGGEIAQSAVRLMSWGGRYLVVGFVSGDIPKIALNILLLKGADIRGVFWGKFSRMFPELQKENYNQIISWIAKDQLKPYIGKQYDFQNALEAFKDYYLGKVKGKVIVTF